MAGLRSRSCTPAHRLTRWRPLATLGPLVPFDLEPEAHRPAEAAGLADDALAEINRLWTIVRAFSNTAHEVNNALQVIAGNVELLQARPLEPDLARRLETISSHTARAAATIERLAGYVRARSLPAERLDLWPLLETAVALRAASTGRRRIRVSIDRQGQEPCWALADLVRTEQAVLNLLLCAEDTLAGRTNARIVVGAAGQADRVVVTVMASADSPAAAEPVPSVEGAAGAITAGAQVWAADYLARAHHGRVTLSDTAEGLRLALTLPAAGTTPADASSR